MSPAPRLAVLTGVVGGLVLLGSPAALAQQACDAYSGGCAPIGGTIDAPAKGPGETAVGGAGQQGGAGSAVVGNAATAPSAVGGGGAATPRTLPFTGAELVMLVAGGLAAVGVGGTAIVLGRRRALPAA